MGDQIRTAVVLGAGGTVGIAYHAGVLKALAEHGVHADDADLVVGTSAGAIVGSIVRSGHDLDEVWQLTQDDRNAFDELEPFFRPDVIFSQGWRTPVGLARRVIGSGYVLHRSVMRWPVVAPPRPLQRFYRAGLGSSTEQRREFAAWTEESWPQRPLALCTFDIVTGRRVVLQADSHGTPALPDAMRASAAVPSVYPPVRVGRRLLVDGAVASSTHLDVALDAGASRIIVVAPQSYRPDDVPPAHLRASKELFHRRLERELRAAERHGAEVLVIRPDAHEARVHGLNLLRSEGHGEVASLAHRRTSDELERSNVAEFVDRWRSDTLTRR